MIQLFLPMLIGFSAVWYALRYPSTKTTRRVGIVLISFATVCFALYFHGILGVGLSSWILDLFGKGLA